MTFADRVIGFNKNLGYPGKLPSGIKIMNPFIESEEALNISSNFYSKYYHDNNARRIILGINPGRHGAGITGVPFTDTKRMVTNCELEFEGFSSHELSSVFVYEMIDAYGGPEKFYSRYYINSVCPLGFTRINDKGKEVNYNYYDDDDFYNLVKPFIIETLSAQLGFGIDTSIAYCLGSGKNYKYLTGLNSIYNYFGKIVPLEHPRYIMQYRLKQKKEYISKFIHALD